MGQLYIHLRLFVFSQGLNCQKIRVHGSMVEMTGGTCSGALEKDKRALLYSFSRESNFPPLGDFIRFVYSRTQHNETRKSTNIVKKASVFYKLLQKSGKGQFFC